MPFHPSRLRQLAPWVLGFLTDRCDTTSVSQTNLRPCCVSFAKRRKEMEAPNPHGHTTELRSLAANSRSSAPRSHSPVLTRRTAGGVFVAYSPPPVQRVSDVLPWLAYTGGTESGDTQLQCCSTSHSRILPLSSPPPPPSLMNALKGGVNPRV